MEDKWLKDIHDRMTDYEVSEPQGLWDDIQKAGGMANTRQKGTIRYWMWSAAAAACLLLGLSLRNVQEHENGALDGMDLSGRASQGIVSVQHDSADKESLEMAFADVSRELSSKGRQETKRQTDKSLASYIAKSPAPMEEAPSKEVGIEKKNEDPTPKPITSSRMSQEKESRRQYLAQSTKEEAGKHRLRLGLSSTGGAGSSFRQLYHGSLLGASTMAGDMEWKDSPLLGIMYMNRGTDTRRKVSHHAPLRTMLSLSYDIDERWSVESGISYALVSSDIEEGSLANYIRDEQRLHYMGVPLGISYRALSWKRLDLYLSGDVLTEKLVSGRTTRSYVLLNEPQDKEVIPTTSHPFQVSLGTKIGAQYNLSNVLSLYVEPGCRYYFDDGSSIETVFKERKLDFSLSMGMRLTVGR